MKKLILLGAIALISVFPSQQEDFNLVFDITSSNPETHENTIRHINFMVDKEPGSNMDVVVYGGSLNMVLKEKSSVDEVLQRLIKNENVNFKVCHTTMKRHGVTPEMLMEGVQIVANPLKEIYKRQKQGWGYIKETNN
jgi:intracellular sulfur oxidation DsrE/DsrF family protein